MKRKWETPKLDVLDIDKTMHHKPEHCAGKHGCYEDPVEVIIGDS